MKRLLLILAALAGLTAREGGSSLDRATRSKLEELDRYIEDVPSTPEGPKLKGIYVTDSSISLELVGRAKLNFKMWNPAQDASMYSGLYGLVDEFV